MIYKLEFSKTYEGLLRIRVKTIHDFECALGIYEDDRTFLRFVKNAGLTSEDQRRIERAVVLAFSPLAAISLCEGLRLSEEQLRLLRLRMALQLHARTNRSVSR
jgi:hypothetical protein